MPYPETKNVGEGDLCTSNKLKTLVNRRLGVRDFIDVEQNLIADITGADAQDVPLVDSINRAKVSIITTSDGVQSRQPVCHVEELIRDAPLTQQPWRPYSSNASNAAFVQRVLALKN